MRRRLDLAAALVAEPSVLFLDAPTTGLDPRSRTDLWGVIRELVAAGTTLLLTTQYLEEADRLAGTIVVIDQGRIIAEGAAHQLKAQVGGERVELVVESASDLAAARGALAQPAVGDVQVDEHTRRLTAPVSGGAGVLMRVLRLLDSAAVGVLDVGLRRPTLDDVFLQLTGHATEPGPQGDGGVDGHPGPSRSTATPPRAGWTVPATCTTTATRSVTRTRRSFDEPGDAHLRRRRRGRHAQPDQDQAGPGHPGVDPDVAHRVVLLFAYVFGSSIEVPGVTTGIFVPDGHLRGYLHRGWSGRGHAEGRHRPLPLPAHVALVGPLRAHGQRHRHQRSVDRCHVGDRAAGGLAGAQSPLEALGRFLLLLVFAYAFSWVMAYVGLLVASPEVVNNAWFMVIFPLMFVANVRAQPQTSHRAPHLRRVEPGVIGGPGLPRAVRQHQPRRRRPDAWSLQNPVLYTLLWAGVIVAIFVPLAVGQYKRTTSR